MTATAKWFTVLFIGVMWSAVSFVAWPALLREQRLRRTAAITQGEIINYEPLNHGRVTYRYTVEGHVYTGFALASQHLVGIPVRVYYSPSDPSISMLTKP